MTSDKPLSSSVTLNGATFFYSLAGPDGAALVIILHGGRGMGSHQSDFSAFLPLTDKYRVLGFDFRGHGNSSLTPPYTFEQIVEDVEAFRKEFVKSEDGKFILLGGSFGGFLAQQYAITYPDHLSHLILRGTAPSHHHEAEAIEVLKGRLHRATNASVGMLHKVFSAFEDDEEFKLVMFALGPLYSESYDPDAGLRSNKRTIFRAETHNALYSEQEKYFDYRNSLHTITANTLIVVGEFDWICPPAQSKLIAEKIPKAALVVVENANHSVHHEKNALVIAKIREHLA